MRSWMSPAAATNDFLVDRALWHYTRGLALVAKSSRQPRASTPHSPPSPVARKPKSSAAPFFPSPMHWEWPRRSSVDVWPEPPARQRIRSTTAKGRRPGGCHTVYGARLLAHTRPPHFGSCFAPGREPAKAEQVFREDLRRPRMAGACTALGKLSGRRADWHKPTMSNVNLGRVVTGRREARSGLVLTDRRHAPRKRHPSFSAWWRNVANHPGGNHSPPGARQ